MKERVEVTAKDQVNRSYRSTDGQVYYVEGKSDFTFIEGSRYNANGKLVDIFVSYDPADIEQAIDLAENSGKGVRGHVVVQVKR